MVVTRPPRKALERAEDAGAAAEVVTRRCGTRRADDAAVVVRPTVLPACCAIADMRARLEWDKEGVRVFESAASTRALLRYMQVAVCVREYVRRRGDEPNPQAIISKVATCVVQLTPKMA